MGISRVVYVVESPLTSRDHNRFGVDVLTNAGFDVEIWEVQDLFLPRDQGPAAVQVDPETGRPRHLLLKVRKGAEVDRIKGVDLPSVRKRSPTNPKSPSVKSPTNTATAQGKPK